MISMFEFVKTTSPFLSRTILWNAVFHVSSLGRRRDGLVDRGGQGVREKQRLRMIAKDKQAVRESVCV